MNNFLLFLPFILFACTNTADHKTTKGITVTAVEASAQKDKTSNIIIKNMDKVYVELEVQAYSVDSVPIAIKFFNDSTTSIWLYRPVLLPESVSNLSIYNDKPYDADGQEIVFKVPPQKLNLYAGVPEVLPAVIPDLHRENIIKLDPKQSISLSYNLAKSYDLRNSLKKGKNSFSVAYFILMPLIREDKHIKEPDTKNDGTEKPVYLALSSKKLTATELEREQFVLFR